VSLAHRIHPIDAVTFDVGLTLLFRPDRELRRRFSREVTTWLKDRGLNTESDGFRRARTTTELAVARLRADGRDQEASEAIDGFVTSLDVGLAAGERAELGNMLERLFRDYPTRAPDGAGETLQSLRERGIKLGIVSNRGKRPGWMAQQYLEICGIASFFEPAAITYSDEVGVRKPDPRIFLLALRALGSRPERAAHVGDSVSRDLAPARDLGMMAIYYIGVRPNPRDAHEADAVISHFRELPTALGLDGPAQR
jgi:HAD superfamily hydrolase (TIGR01509 family)